MGIKDGHGDTVNAEIFGNAIECLFGHGRHRILRQTHRPSHLRILCDIFHTIRGDHCIILGCFQDPKRTRRILRDAERRLRIGKPQVHHVIQIFCRRKGRHLAKSRCVSITEDKHATLVGRDVVDEKTTFLLLTVKGSTLQLIVEKAILKRGECLGHLREVVEDRHGRLGSRGLPQEVENDHDGIGGLLAFVREGVVVDLLAYRAEIGLVCCGTKGEIG